MDQAATSSIIDTHDEKVLIAVSALGDMRGTGLAVDNDMGPGPSSSSAYWDRGTHSRGGSSSVRNAIVVVRV